MKRGIKITLIAFLSAIILLFSIRLINPAEIDDVSPERNCLEIDKYNLDILYVIPYYNNKPISENREWCEYILSLNKTLALHGITHEYREFSKKNISQGELNFAIDEFEKCFGFKPEMFKPPYLHISETPNRSKLRGIKICRVLID